MPTFGHDTNCQRECCALVRESKRVQRMLSTMTFHQRKAYRIATRKEAPNAD